MRVVIDRFEGEYAICEKEDGQVVNVKRNKLPENSREGDVLLIDGENIRLDRAETELRRRKIEKLADDLWE